MDYDLARQNSSLRSEFMDGEESKFENGVLVGFNRRLQGCLFPCPSREVPNPGRGMWEPSEISALEVEIAAWIMGGAASGQFGGAERIGRKRRQWRF